MFYIDQEEPRAFR
ncbi:5, 10-methenyltetrahydrofolate synthetase, isoform CRA_c [Mus musculus]|nr:5, 10-methenyltetrahydrofolate synthetase, isoform CRA_c [Mus musculus]